MGCVPWFGVSNCFSVSLSLHASCRSVLIYAVLPPPSCSGVMAPVRLIPSRGIGDIRANPLPTKGGISLDEEQWDRADQSEWRSDRTRRRNTVDELLGAKTFFLIVEDPAIQPVWIYLCWIYVDNLKRLILKFNTWCCSILMRKNQKSSGCDFSS